MAITRTKVNKTAERLELSAVSASAVEARAYEIWLEEGMPEGRAMDHWLQAEREVSSERSKLSNTVSRSPRVTKTRAAEDSVREH